MSVKYERLWKLLIDNHMKKTDLINTCHLSSNVIARLGKDKYVSMETIDKICQYFHCNIEDIMEISTNKEKIK